MNKYEVSANDVTFGVYEAETEGDARDLCARDAGYESEFDMTQALGEPSAMVATEVEEWSAWVDGRKDEAVTFHVPADPRDCDFMSAACDALGIDDPCEELNVEKL